MVIEGTAVLRLILQGTAIDGIILPIQDAGVPAHKVEHVDSKQRRGLIASDVSIRVVEHLEAICQGAIRKRIWRCCRGDVRVDRSRRRGKVTPDDAGVSHIGDGDRRRGRSQVTRISGNVSNGLNAKGLICEGEELKTDLQRESRSSG